MVAIRAPRCTWGMVAMRRLLLVLSAVLTSVIAVLGLMPAASAATPLPVVMASAGDSITRGYDATLFGCFLADCTQYSWSTGTSSTVNSHYSRLRTLQPSLTAYNDAKTGAKMADLDGQLRTAGTQHADYVTVLMGANDVCTSSISTMTPTATVQAQFRQALTDYKALWPSGHVFVSSIPNVYQLWSLLHTNSSAVSTWRNFKICQSMLASTNTEAQRQQVLGVEQADNDAIASVCVNEFAGLCRWDNGATFGYQFKTTDVSTVDYFHPSVRGQATLAALTWGASYWAA